MKRVPLTLGEHGRVIGFVDIDSDGFADVTVTDTSLSWAWEAGVNSLSISPPPEEVW